MTVRQIRLFGDPVLRGQCTTIDEFDEGVRALVDDLVETVQLPGRAGVAAPQIGVGLRAFSYNIDGDIGYVLNPVLVETSGEPEKIGEGCLSVPGLWHEVLRYPHAKVRGVDVDGNPIEVEGDGVLAQALQHETDHLDGKLYIDRLDPAERRVAMREIRESDWF
ncbi:peptide deformylase [Microbacterium protaetiae]|uniref:Peptide deformylase n=1 Tax=Microbacterium protaetiae TaxID=2509458 RepID=A0A4P6EI18_9MICO|nr:peptide deformylase [Microbacterium protaetiae]QAY61606.1 peptide deformylase [Microbacterium protaetiae]